jgi:glyceraldehyde 3-phosphate dehydrogenase
MTVKIGINGLGRIGRCVLRAFLESGRTDIEIVAVNFRGNTSDRLHLIKYDSTHGTLKMDVSGDENFLQIGKHKIKRFNQSNPAEINWKEANVDVVLECTGEFNKRSEAAGHLAGGAKSVVISAPAPDADATIVIGVNNNILKPEHKVISIGSCTTNCLALIAKILHDAFGIEQGYMTTIHAFTSDQNILDNSHRDLRRARTATSSMIPTSTGAAKTIGLIIPELKGKLDGVAIRVPVPNVSLVDLSFNTTKDVTAESINHLVKSFAEGALKGILGYCTEPLVSIDFNKDSRSSIFDATQTCVMGKTFARIAAWYDNEWGFSNRMLDAAKLVG